MIQERSTIEAFGKALCEVGQERSEVVALVADTLKSMGVLSFRQACPERVFDLGIAEQNMIMAAAGLASTGKIVFAASYAVFLSMRTLEQIRTFIAYPGLKVRVVAGLGGLSGAMDGVTHQGTEDLSLLRAIPNMTVINPADAGEVEKAVRALVDWPGPAYLRLARIKSPVLFGEDHPFQIGKANLLNREGEDVALIAGGLPLRLALEGAEALKGEGISAQVLECHTLKPIDQEALVSVASQCGAAVTIEENNILGGLGSAVAEVLSEQHPIPILRLGIADCYSESASQDQLCQQAGLTVENLVRAAKRAISLKREMAQKWAQAGRRYVNRKGGDAMILYKMKWPEVKAEVEKGTPVLVPVGSTEQHGYHLPVDTDMAICYHIAEKAAERSNTIVAPPLNFGYNEKEYMFPGTISLQSETLLHCLVDICLSLTRSGFRRIAIINGHGYNRFIVPQAAHIAMEKSDALVAAITYWDLIADLVEKHRESKLGGISHSCEFETSCKLYLDPQHVDMSKAAEEVPPILSRYTWSDLASASPVYIRARFDKLSKSGVMGNPLLASGEKGKIWVEGAIERLADFLERFKKDFDHLLP